MDPHLFERWPDLDRIFAEALDRAPEERLGFVRQECGGDQELEREILRLLEALENSGDFLEDPSAWIEGLGPLADVGSQDLTGEVIGAYRLVKELGHGGMGTVYLAERADGAFQHQVALKLLQSRLASREEVRRFQRERQILANLQHSNIASILDGGVDHDGRPYFVMEYVQGELITQYADHHRLTIDQRLGLMGTVCSAVHHAHQNLVVHRDIKPGNVLVTPDGIPKLLDFGIAKLLGDAEGEDATLETRTGHRVMTPAYASPEQVQGGPLTTASDIYQLGILLYEFLTGHRPFRATAGVLELERSITTESPLKPSLAVVKRPSGTPQEAGRLDRGDSDRVREEAEPDPREDVGRARSTTVDRLRRRLQGDLDNIVLKAIRKEPERRYRSARELADDLERHLSGHPVLARPDVFSYRAGKFVRRHRFGVAVGMMAVLSVLIFGAVLIGQNQRIIRERDRAEAVTAFILNLFEQANPDQEGQDLTVRQFLDEGAERVRRELEEEPEVRTAVMNVIGQAYRELGDLESARAILEEAVTQGSRALGSDHLDVAAAQNALGLVIVYQNVDYPLAERLFRDALATQERLLGERDPTTLLTLNNLALSVHSQGRLDEAEALYRQVLLGHESSEDEGAALRRATTLTNLGWLLQARGAREESDSLFRQALDVRRVVYEEDHPRLANSLSALASSRILLGRFESADSLARQALAMRRRLLGATHSSVAENLKSLGDIAVSRGDWTVAREFYQEALSLYRETIGPRSQSAAWVLMSMADLFNTCGEYEQGVTMGQEGYEIYRDVLGEDHPYTAISLGHLARAVHGTGDLDQAEALYNRALEVLKASYPQGSSSITWMQAGLGELYLDRDRPSAAEPLLRQALAARQSLPSPTGWRTWYTQALLGRALEGVDSVQKGLALLDEASRNIGELLGPGDIRAVRVEAWLQQSRGRVRLPE
jgi:eukaryotic-like serine/threonine-protein kinase